MTVTFSGGSQAQSAAAAAGPGASTSTSTSTGPSGDEKPAVEETENNNVYYPCDEGVDCPDETDGDGDGDYDDSYQYPDDPAPSQEPEDAVVVPSNESPPQADASQAEDPDSVYDYGDFPTFENCNSLEDCLGVPKNDTSPEQLGADLVDYYYNSGDNLRPGDSVVSRPVFTPDGQALINTAAATAGAASAGQLDNLIGSLTSLLKLLNTTKRQGNDDPDKNNYFKIPPGFGSGQMGNVPLPGVVDDSLDADGEEEYQDLNKPLSHVGGLEDGRPLAHFKVRKPLPAQPATTSAPPGTTIPPHLIPIGPDGQPLLNPGATVIQLLFCVSICAAE